MSHISWRLLCLIPMILLFVHIQSYGQVPQTINYQGQLLTSESQAVTATQSIKFCLYEALSGGESLWCETHPSVDVVNGSFNVALGSITSLSDLKFDVPYFLGITVGTDAEMLPRLTLGSAPTALQAESVSGGRTQVVDCAAGDKIMDALARGASTITVKGTCTEDVDITRDDVTLNADITGGGVTGAIADSGAINVDGARRITINGLTVQGHETTGTGIFVERGASIDITDVTVQNSGGDGILIITNSTVNIQSSTITNNTFSGIRAFSGSTLFIGDPDGVPGDVVISNNDIHGLFTRSTYTIFHNTTFENNLVYAISANEYSYVSGGIGGNTISRSSIDPPAPLVSISNSTLIMVSPAASTITAPNSIIAIEASGHSEIALRNINVSGGTGTALNLSHFSFVNLLVDTIITGAVNCSDNALYFNPAGVAVSSGTCLPE